MLNDPKLANSHKYYEWSPEEVGYNWQKKLKRLWEVDKEFYFKTRPIPEFNWGYHHFG